jgi:hypothetical protein
MMAMLTEGELARASPAETPAAPAQKPAAAVEGKMQSTNEKTK